MNLGQQGCDSISELVTLTILFCLKEETDLSASKSPYTQCDIQTRLYH